ncbi:hypothetical protein BGX29_003312 [Mortierella sp. GBA35]|nr:hypothetical protein BGX29_003312 [Mortierella sp. GBA35]
MPFPVFTCDSPLEYFWRSQVWGVLDTLFFDISNTLMIGGESPGIESTERRNQQHQGRSKRKMLGSKSDDYLCMFGTSKADWMSATAQIHVMTSLGGAVTVLRRRSPLMLAQSIQHIHENITILEIFLLMKQDIVRTLAQDRRKFSASDLFKGSISRTSSPLPASFSIPLAHPGIVRLFPRYSGLGIVTSGAPASNPPTVILLDSPCFLNLFLFFLTPTSPETRSSG